ncbi:putative Metallo-beta-lactamase domain-containing protein [Seiridium unicorne]|uniref:Metallo-beta-lactamase domain-containing protein n=1 Tax=Seiridium unicorne TaxID=138068 RepID=A0ABR2V239_9PEZI
MVLSDHLYVNPAARQPLLREHKHASDTAHNTLLIKETHMDPHRSASENDKEDGSIYFIGTATTIIQWGGLKILTDPNFLHAGDHVHLGPGVNAERKTNPAVEIDELPPMDLVLLSHYHEDHFDQEVEGRLNRTFPIITTPHAKGCLADSKRKKDDTFNNVHALDFWESLTIHVDDEDGKLRGNGGEKPVVKITGMPGKHVPPGPLSIANDFLSAVPPTNGWLLELGYDASSANAAAPADAVQTGYRIYISGDTLLVDELKEIPRWLKDEKIDLMLVHLGGTTIPGPSVPLLMVTMDAAQGLELMKLMNPDLTIPIHYDDYSVFLSPLSDFKEKVKQEGWEDRVVYLDRGELYRFKVREV